MYLYQNKRVAHDTLIWKDGNAYSVSNETDRQIIGVTEVPDPVWPTPAENYYVTENEDGSLNIVEKSVEQIAQQEAGKRSQQRAALFRDADILFMKEQRGEVEAGTWLAECKRIREEFPK